MGQDLPPEAIAARRNVTFGIPGARANRCEASHSANIDAITRAATLSAGYILGPYGFGNRFALLPIGTIRPRGAHAAVFAL